MVSLNPTNLMSVVDNYYDVHAASHEAALNIKPATNASEVFAMRKVSSLDGDSLKKLEKLGITKNIRHPVLIQKRWGGAVGISQLISSQNVGFKADGPDDMANLAKETVEGVAQPLVHLGVLGLFYPFVAMGAKGLAADHRDLLEAKAELQNELQEQRSQLESLHGELKENGVQLPILHTLQVQNVKELPVLFRQMSRSIQNHFAKHGKDEKFEQLSNYLKEAIRFGFVLKALDQTKQDQKESWCAATGMRGMQRAMQLFIVDAISSLGAFILKGAAASTMTSIATGVGVLGTGVMAGAQFLMMTSGLIKARIGIKSWQDMRQNIKADQQKLHKIEEPDVKHSLTRKIAEDKRLNLWQTLQKVVPGLSLATGQALMLGWSVTSLALIVSGVAAPVGIAMMLALLVPGVGLTLAASLPKIGLEAQFDRAIDKRFGCHDEDEGFDKVAYIQELPRDAKTLAQHELHLTQLLQEVESKDVATLTQSLAPQKNETETFNNVYSLLAKVDRLEDFSAELFKIKGARTLFEAKHVVEEKEVKPIFSWSHLKNPLQLKSSRLFHQGDSYTKVKTLMHFQPERVEKSAVRTETTELAVGILKDFMTRQLRAELYATRSAFEFAGDI